MILIGNSEGTKDVRDDFEGRIDVRIGGVPCQAETQTSRSRFWIDIHRTKHAGDFERATRAGGST